VERAADFDVAALYAALDARRVERRLSWQQVAREISGVPERMPAGKVNSSTLTRLRERGAVEGDGVLQMLSGSAARRRASCGAIRRGRR
jgi:hypothetical protein